MNIENRYIVLKHSDVTTAKTLINPEDLQALERIECAINQIRERRGKAPLKGILVEDDWEEYEYVCKSIKARCAEIKVNISEVFVGEAYESNNQIIIIGKPNDDEALPEEQRHNCDDMGCGQAHVLYRFNKE